MRTMLLPFCCLFPPTTRIMLPDAFQVLRSGISRILPLLPFIYMISIAIHLNTGIQQAFKEGRG